MRDIRFSLGSKLRLLYIKTTIQDNCCSLFVLYAYALKGVRGDLGESGENDARCPVAETRNIRSALYLFRQGESRQFQHIKGSRFPSPRRKD
jgi:hypothetical protein